MSRLNVILIVLLAVQLGIVVIQRIGGEPEVAPAGPMFDGLSRSAIQEVVLTDGVDAVTLRRADAGFGVAESAGYPAATEKLDELLHDLVALATREMVSRSSAHHVDLEVADGDFNRKVTVSTLDGEHTFYVGKSGRGGSTFVRRQGEDAVYAVTDFSSHKLTVRPAAWVERVVFEADKNRIHAIELRNEHGTLRLDRAALDGWSLAGDPAAPLDATEVDKLLGKVATVRLKEVAGATSEVPLGDVVAEATIHVAAVALPNAAVGGDPAPVGIPHTLRIAPKPGDDKTFLAQLDQQPYVVELTQWAIKPLLETVDTDLLVAPEE